MTASPPSDLRRIERGHELFELGLQRWGKTTSTRWPRPNLVPRDQLAVLERDARADLLLVLVATRGLDDVYSGREDDIEGDPVYLAARDADPAATSLLNGAVYACDKSVHLALTIADMAAAAPVAGGAYGQVPYGGGLYRPVLRWPAAGLLTGRGTRANDKRRGYRETFEGNDAATTLAALASWFARWPATDSLDAGRAGPADTT